MSDPLEYLAERFSQLEYWNEFCRPMLSVTLSMTLWFVFRRRILHRVCDSWRREEARNSKSTCGRAHTGTEALWLLGVQIAEMEQQKERLQQTIEELEGIPIPVAERFAELVDQGERKSAWRDYALFGLGVVVSTVVAIILGLLGLWQNRRKHRHNRQPICSSTVLRVSLREVVENYSYDAPNPACCIRFIPIAQEAPQWIS
jgi:hypothetical protein